LYLSGKFYLDKRTFAKTDTAIDLLQRAINFDPQFALAYAALGRAYSTKIFAGDRTQGLEEKASIAIEKALTLDPRLAEGYVARAVLLWTKMNGFPHERAIRELYKALSINPNLVEAHEWVGTILSHVGLLDKALDHYRQAIILDPTSTIAPPRVARVLWYEQRYAESLERFQEIPGTAWRDDRARVLQYLGRNDEAFAALMDTPAGIEEEPQRGDQPLSNPDLSGGLALLYAAKGDTNLAIRQIARLRQAEAFSSHFHHAEYTIACSYALMRKNAAALEWLRRAADDGLPCYPLFQSDPFLASLRSDPAYISMMERMKQQWEHFKDTL
jgi:tetratricopeptide (TPR) repeat protein